jgi:hypothetical protein
LIGNAAAAATSNAAARLIQNKELISPASMAPGIASMMVLVHWRLEKTDQSAALMSKLS